MGVSILCNGKRTDRPYVFEEGKIRVYSIEELCYYIYNNIYYIDKEFFNQGLINWIAYELKLQERAEKLLEMKEEKADFSSLVVVLLCSSDYYNQNEIQTIVQLLEKIGKMTVIEKRCYRADNYLKNKNYERALRAYDQIIKSHEASGLPAKKMGKIIHNLGVAKAHSQGMREGLSCFMKAYELSLDTKSLAQYLYGLLILNDEKTFKEAIIKYKVNRQQGEKIMEKFITKREDTDQDLLIEVEELRVLLDKGHIKEFRQKSREIMDQWAEKYKTKSL